MTIALLDGDVIAYNACKNRFKTPDGFTLVTIDTETFTPEQNEAYLEEAWITFQEMTNELIETCFADEYKMAVKGLNNFRDIIYPEYKANRKSNRDDFPFVPILRQRAVDANMAIAADGMEADDLLRIWREEAILEGKDYIISSIDKDLQCIPGRHYLMHKNQFVTVSEEEALRFFYEQLLKGDPTDNIKGIPSIGPVKAKRILEKYSTEEEFQFTVVSCYQDFFGDDWLKELTLNGKLLYLRKTRDDEFSIANWPNVPYIKLEETECINLGKEV